MTDIFHHRMTASIDEDFVVFLIGMRINNFWKLHDWLSVARAMPRMISELYDKPELGMISHESWFGRTTIMVQYWKSFELLEAYAKSSSSNHLPAWRDFNKRVAASGSVGIWHETYQCRKTEFKCIYNNMPKFGLAKAGNHISVSKKQESASERFDSKNN